MAEVRFHPEAQQEYQEALAWYAVRSRQAAHRFEAEIERTQKLIVENPLQFADYDDGRRLALLRRYPYYLIFEIDSEQVYIIAVAHARRAPNYWQARTT